MSTLTANTVQTTVTGTQVVTTLIPTVVESSLTVGPVTIGGTSSITLTSPTVLSALRAVAWSGSTVVYADPATHPVAIGITTNSGTTVDVQYGGTLTDSGWSWTPGPIWLGANGTLTQTPPIGAIVALGRAVNATTMVIEIEQPIYRS